jgi:Fe-S-cluster-containing hydrogenase component 2
MQILVQDALCSGCRACEVACVAWHDGRFGTATARIRVRKVEHLGVARPLVCHTCVDAHCVEACPTSALSRDEATSAVLLNADDCIACSACADACTFGCVAIHPSSSHPLICDLCNGQPACVVRCVTGALRYGSPEADDPGRAAGA